MKIKTFRSNGRGEFTSNEFKSYLSNHGISHQISCPHTPQQNGVVERKHRHIIETVIALLSQSSLDYSFWSFAAQTVVTLINLLPTSVLYWKFPWFTLYSSFLDLTHLKIFGCAYYPNLRPCTAHKLEPRTRECIFIGYPSQSKGYLCLDLHTNRVYTSRHVAFDESKFPFALPVQSVSTNTYTPTVPTWLSNQLYLHSTNQSSLLGPYPSHSLSLSHSNSSTSSSTTDSSLLPDITPTPLPSPSTSLHSSLPSTGTNTVPLPVSTLTNPVSLPLSHHDSPPPVPLPLPTFNSHPMQTRSKSGITKPNPKLCYKATIDYTYTEPLSYKIASILGGVRQWLLSFKLFKDSRPGLLFLLLHMLTWLAANGCSSLN